MNLPKTTLRQRRPVVRFLEFQNRTRRCTPVLATVLCEYLLEDDNVSIMAGRTGAQIVQRQNYQLTV